MKTIRELYPPIDIALFLSSSLGSSPKKMEVSSMKTAEQIVNEIEISHNIGVKTAERYLNSMRTFGQEKICLADLGTIRGC